MAVEAVGAATGNQKTASGTRGTLGLTGEDFLQLLVAQLRYQNPLAPMDNLQFMTQLAQFAVLQEMVTLRGELEEAKQQLEELGRASLAEQEAWRALNLMGHEVSAKDAEGHIYTGVVTGVRLVDGVPYLLLGEVAVKLDEVLEVRSPAETEARVETEEEQSGSA
ncbi:MAG: flagellar hook assembly protein FlgD [Moorellales bacterium]